MNNKQFFFDGGTLSIDAPSYIKRSADTELLDLLKKGEFCYVLTPRQMGKSSLLVRTEQLLADEGLLTAFIDLSEIGKRFQTHEKWYLGLAKWIGRELKIVLNLNEWWKEQGEISSSQKFSEFLKEIVLNNTNQKQNIIIFIDEIDTTRDLDFADDFFGIIRACFNARARDISYNRLTFALFGSASPSDLMPDETRTPFNIGRGIQLNDFTFEECRHFLNGLPFENNEEILKRMYYWTNGQPYLTQRLCFVINKSDKNSWNNQNIDELVDNLFLGENAWKDKNLIEIKRQLKIEKLVSVYRKVSEKQTKYDENNIWHNRLQLSGIVRSVNGFLTIRNKIYENIFNKKWILENMPVNWYKRVAYGFGITLFIALLIYIFIILPAQRKAELKAELALAEKELALKKAVYDSTRAELAKTNKDYLQAISNLDSMKVILERNIQEREKLLSQSQLALKKLDRLKSSVFEGIRYETYNPKAKMGSLPTTLQIGDISFPTIRDMEYKTTTTVLIPFYDPYFRPNMVISREQLKKVESLESFITRQKQIIQQSSGLGKFERIDSLSTYVQIGSLKGYKMVYLIKPTLQEHSSVAGNKVKQMQIFFVIDKLVYSITASTSEETWEMLEPYFMKIIRGFKLEYSPQSLN